MGFVFDTFKLELFTYFVKYFYNYIQYLLLKEELKPVLESVLITNKSAHFFYNDPRKTLKFFIKNASPYLLDILSYVPSNVFDLGNKRNVVMQSIKKMTSRIVNFSFSPSFSYSLKIRHSDIFEHLQKLEKMGKTYRFSI